MGEDLSAPEREVDWMRRLSAAVQRPVSFALSQHNLAPEQWRRDAPVAGRGGRRRRSPAAGRGPALNLLVGFQTFHPFKWRPSYMAIEDLPLPSGWRAQLTVEVRTAILGEQSANDDPILQFVNASLDRIFPMGEPPDYEPSADRSVRAIAEREGRPEENLDLMLEHDGRNLLMFALLGYSHGSLDDMREMLLHPTSALGLADGGAHCGVLCDASMPTFMLTHWARDRSRASGFRSNWSCRR